MQSVLVMAELGNFSLEFNGSDNDNDGTVSVDMCDYGFVDECDDKKKLQGILNLLLSGKEGHYPEVRSALLTDFLKVFVPY